MSDKVKTFTKIAKTVGDEVRKGRQSRAFKKSMDRASKGKYLKDKADYMKAKADLAKAKTAAKRTRYRAAAAATAASSWGSQQGNRAKEALNEWNTVINSNPEPAEGTGEAQAGSNAGTGNSTGIAPTGV